MCSTCGCGSPENGYQVITPEEAKALDHNKYHNHDHVHDHQHDEQHHHARHNPSSIIELEKNILSQNNLLAERNRGYFLAKNIQAFNLVSSPGSGKTTLLEKTISQLKKEFIIQVIEGDQQTYNDARRIEQTGAEVVQINTGQGCHLDAAMVNEALLKLNPPNNSCLFIENVGNLVCPALFDLGEAERVVIISVTEGDDKPLKYPFMFESSHVCIINKSDLLPYVDFNVEKVKDYALRINHHLTFFELSATTGQGTAEWYDWLRKKFSTKTG